MEYISLFPTAVGRSKIELTDEERAYLLNEALSVRDNIGNLTSKNSFILNHKPMIELRGKFEQAVNDYFNEVFAPEYNVTLYITQSWLNVTKKGQFHHKHHHPGSLISGVFYLSVDQDDKIMFYRDGKQMLDFPNKVFNQFNSSSWWLPAEEQGLLIFPSLLEHHVPPVQTDHQRISMAFNTWFYGTAGSQGDMTELNLERPER